MKYLHNSHDIDWDLATKLAAIPCGLIDAAIALRVTDTKLRKALTTQPDVALAFAAAHAALRYEPKTLDGMCERARRIAEVVEEHRAGM